MFPNNNTYTSESDSSTKFDAYFYIYTYWIVINIVVKSRWCFLVWYNRKTFQPQAIPVLVPWCFLVWYNERRYTWLQRLVLVPWCFLVWYNRWTRKYPQTVKCLGVFCIFRQILIAKQLSFKSCFLKKQFYSSIKKDIWIVFAGFSCGLGLPETTLIVVE